MRWQYIVCKECGSLSPSPGYSRPAWKGIKDVCIWCLKKLEVKKKGGDIKWQK